MQITKYVKSECVVFCKTKEKYGALSSMSSGYPLRVNGYDINTSEALYQACKFPHSPELQHKIINAKSPFAAEIIGKQYREQVRQDWSKVAVDIMLWSLQVKLAEHWNNFGGILESTGNMPIVKYSRTDEFWGAKQSNEDENILEGYNVFGKLLMILRSKYLSLKEPVIFGEGYYVEPLEIDSFHLLGEPIETIYSFTRNIRRSEMLNRTAFVKDEDGSLSRFVVKPRYLQPRDYPANSIHRKRK